MSTNPKGLFQNGKDSEMNLCSDVENSKRIVLQFKETGLHLGYHLDPVQGPAGCRLQEVSPLLSATAHLIAPNFNNRVDILICRPLETLL